MACIFEFPFDALGWSFILLDGIYLILILGQIQFCLYKSYFTKDQITNTWHDVASYTK